MFPASHGTREIMALYCVLGAALSLFGSVIWPCVPLVVKENFTGTAIGLTTAMQNFGMAISPMALAFFKTATGGYTLPFLYIIVCVAIGTLSGIIIWIKDVRGDRKLMT